MSATHRVIMTVLVSCLLVVACGNNTAELTTRSVDDLQVADPAEVASARPDLVAAPGNVEGENAAAPAPSRTDTEAEPAGARVPATTAPTDTIPLAEDDRSAGEKMFEAYQDFSTCLEDEGQEFKGDPRGDAGLEADSDYMDALVKCAARSNIAEAAGDYQSAQENLSSDEIREQNERFVELEDCLLGRGWTIETSTNKDGLITPSVFVSPSGELDSRDIEQCSAERNISDT